MTVAMLLLNTLEAAEARDGGEARGEGIIGRGD